MALSATGEARAREIISRLAELRAEEDRLQLELFAIAEDERLLTDGNAYYSATQIEEMEDERLSQRP